MLKITAFGKFCRSLRIERGELLRDMAEHLNVSAAYLSAVEIGKRKIPGDWRAKIVAQYELNDDYKRRLDQAIELSLQEIKINLQDSNDQQREVALAFARKIESLDQAALKKIMNVIERGTR